jgi:outer membrane protein insertion porin family
MINEIKSLKHQMVLGQTIVLMFQLSVILIRLTNRFNYTIFNEFFENNITTFNISLASANSISNDDVKLSERLFIPSRRLRGFEAGKVGPKDGNDFIGGNYSATFNAQTNIPKIFKIFKI